MAGGRKPRGAKKASRRRGAGRVRRNNPSVGDGKRMLTSQRVTTSFSGRAPASRIEEQDEYLADISGSVGFVTAAYPVNPGQVTTFPWLSNIAKNFEKYSIVALEFYYRRTVSEFATNGQAGKVMMSFDVDAADAPPVNKQQVEDTFPHSDGMPCENISLVIPAKLLNSELKTHFVRPGGLPGATDVRMYDVGNFFISTIGCTNTTVIGELRVRYRIKLDTPLLAVPAALPINNSVSEFTTVNQAVAATATVASLLLATVITNGCSVVNTAGSFVLPTGNYLVDFVAKFNNDAGVFSSQIWLEKNNVTVNSAFSHSHVTAATADGTYSTMGAFLHYIASNGTDVYRVRYDVTFAAGSQLASGAIRFTAI
jgi:hypothetical protein